MGAGLTEESLEIAARCFRLLGEPQRLRILQALVDGERTVNDIVEVVDGSQSNVSKHLQALADGGLVRRRREGNHIYYWLADRTVFQLCELVCGRANPRRRGANGRDPEKRR